MRDEPKKGLACTQARETERENPYAVFIFITRPHQTFKRKYKVFDQAKKGCEGDYLSPGTKQTVRNNEVSVKQDLTVYVLLLLLLTF